MMLIIILSFMFYAGLLMSTTIILHEIGHMIILKAFKVSTKVRLNLKNISIGNDKELKKLSKAQLLLVYITGIFAGILPFFLFLFNLGRLSMVSYEVFIYYYIFLIGWFIIYWWKGCRSDWRCIAWCLYNGKKNHNKI